MYLYDADGNQYLDGSGGAAVSCLGHGHPGVIAAIKAQLDRLAYAHTAFFTNEPQERLAGDLADRFGPRDSRVYFLSGGSEANETALKLVRQYWVAHGQAGKGIIISRNQSYHGNTLGALSLSGNPQRRELYGPLLKNWPKTEPCYEYRHRQRDESSEGYALRSADSLEQLITEHGAENIAAFFAETVVGATLGAVPAVPGYFRRIREICDQHDILLVLDEVMSGSGRTGSYFAFEQEGVVPDIVTIAKGLAGGYQPLGAAIVRGFVHDGIVDASGAFSHGHTYVGHATACAAGLAVSDIVRREGPGGEGCRVRSRGCSLRSGRHLPITPMWGMSGAGGILLVSNWCKTVRRKNRPLRMWDCRKRSGASRWRRVSCVTRPAAPPMAGMVLTSCWRHHTYVATATSMSWCRRSRIHSTRFHSDGVVSSLAQD